MASAVAEVDWGDLDKRRFLMYGGVLFTGASAALYPLSVLKTHQMVSRKAETKGFSGVVQTLKKVYGDSGVRGFYRGFPTVVFGSIPARGIYLSTLEVVKYSVLRARGLDASSVGPGEAARASFVAGAVASLCTQMVIVPVDVISQRQMIYSRGNKGLGFWSVTRDILRNEGLSGLYRGLPISVLTFVPSSAIWWSAYGAYQRLLWSTMNHYQCTVLSPSSTRDVMVVQTMSAVLAGATAATLTTPLDVVKTRLQVSTSKIALVETIRTVQAEDGWRGFFRGMAPRVINVSIWGTTMVTTYEILKRLARKRPQEG